MAEENVSRLAENILYFCRTLRRAGLPIGPGQVIDASIAVLESGIERRDDFYFALRSVLATDPTQFRLFDQAFHIYFRNPRLLERMMGLLLPTLQRARTDDDNEEAARRLVEALSDVKDTDEAPDNDDVVVEIDQSDSYSRREMLRHKDFEQMSLGEQIEAARLLRDGIAVIRDRPTRRFRPDNVGHHYDIRQSIRKMMRTNGQLIELARKKRRLRPPSLILICDISGSMSRYARPFLQFAHALSTRGQTVHTFVFGTRLTNISHRLVDRDVDRALGKVSTDVQDWDGGTRIADCLKRFNIDWGRRVLSGHSVVVLLSDGLERDSVSDLGFQTGRLQRSCDQLIWMNPMLRFDEFEPKASGIKAMLPFVDLFLPAHNVVSLAQLGEILSQPKLISGRRTA